MINPPSANTTPVPVAVPPGVVTPMWTTEGAVASTRSAVPSVIVGVGNVIGVGEGGIVMGVGVDGIAIGVGVGCGVAVGWGVG